MVTIRTDKGYEYARDEARKQLVAPRISLVFFVKDDPYMRDWVFRSGGAR